MDHQRPGERELGIARRYAVYAVIGGVLAWSAAGVSSFPTGRALAFLLWLGTILAGTQAVVALVIGMWRRSHAS